MTMTRNRGTQRMEMGASLGPLVFLYLPKPFQGLCFTHNSLSWSGVFDEGTGETGKKWVQVRPISCRVIYKAGWYRLITSRSTRVVFCQARGPEGIQIPVVPFISSSPFQNLWTRELVALQPSRKRLSFSSRPRVFLPSFTLFAPSAPPPSITFVALPPLVVAVLVAVVLQRAAVPSRKSATSSDVLCSSHIANTTSLHTSHSLLLLLLALPCVAGLVSSANWLLLHSF
ncbi:hypothetical protein B0T09DRAFT_165574 [Sordaria sp. MPI-SDFR-AT-0083]|nr:hypothetical protein B0T09DRAFT_165574 [Sordaria sp. MPI-SDFR-AT-0083]